jgi:hypothetical protein
MIAMNRRTPSPLFTGLAVILALLFVSTNFASAQPAAPGTPSPQDEIRSATMRYYVALNSLLHGDIAPMEVVWSHRSDISNLGTGGDRTMGWNGVHTYYQNLGRQNLGGKVTPEDVSVVTQGTMGYSVCTERGQIRSPEGPMTNYNQRSTNVFRLEEGKWKLVHHHVDTNTLAEPSR